jgi:hypothetical protein
MSDVSSLVEIILRITRDVRSRRRYKKTHLSVTNNTLFPHKSNMPHTVNHKGTALGRFLQYLGKSVHRRARDRGL